MQNFLKFSIIFICTAGISFPLWPNEFTETLRSFNYKFINPSTLLSYLNIETNATLEPIEQDYPDIDKKCGFLTLYLMGGLGNLISAMATIIGLSLSTNRIGILPQHIVPWRVFEFFPNLNKYLTVNETLVVNGTWERFGQRTFCCHYDPTILERMTDCKKNYFLGGYFMAWQYFHNHSGEIKHAFALNSTLVEKANRRINNTLTKTFNVSRSNTYVVGIHNRRGDFVDQRAVDSGRMPGSDEYFKASMLYFRRKHYFEEKSVIFFIVSNDYEYNVKAFGNASDVFVVKPEEGIDDLALLIICDELILSASSTYSWWAGYLNRGQVVISALVAKKNSSVYREMDRGYYLPTWLQI